MKLLKKSLMETNRNFPPSGSVLVQIESEDDIYHLYNIISEGDHVETITNRFVFMQTNECKIMYSYHHNFPLDVFLQMSVETWMTQRNQTLFESQSNLKSKLNPLR